MALELAADVNAFVAELTRNANPIFAPVGELGSDENILRLGIVADVRLVRTSVWVAMMRVGLYPITRFRVRVIDIVAVRLLKAAP